MPEQDALDLAVEEINSEGSESTSEQPEAEEVAAAEETEATETEVEASEAEDGEEPTDKADSPLFSKLMEKYGGDKEKLAAGVYEQQNSLSRIQKQIDGIETLLQQRLAETEPEEEAGPNPDVQVIEQELADYTEELKGNEAKRGQILANINKANLDIARMQGKLEKAEDWEKTNLESKITAEEANRDRLRDKWEDLDRRDRQVIRERQKAELRKSQAEQEAESARQEERRHKEELKAVGQKTLSTFFDAFKEASGSYKMTQESVDYMAKAVRRDVREHLESLGPGAPEIGRASCRERV